MFARNVVIKGTWTPDSPDVPVPDSRHKVTVHYVYKEDGTKAADDNITDNLAKGDTYSIASPKIEGYTSDLSVVSGTMGTEDIEITVTYTKNDSGNNGEDPDPDNPDPDKPDPDKPEPDNPGPDNPTPDNPKPDNPTPDIPNPETHKVTVHYIYADGSRAADDAVRDNLTEGTIYSITSPGISGYTPDQSIVNGTMGTEDVEITVTYTRNSSGNSGGGGSNGGGGGGGSRTTNIRGRVLGSTPDSEPDVPVAEVPDEDVPLANIPVDIPDADVPLAGIVQWNIPDDDVPLAAVPRTGDSSGVWHMMAILSAFGLMAMSLLDKKKCQE